MLFIDLLVYSIDSLVYGFLLTEHTHVVKRALNSKCFHV